MLNKAMTDTENISWWRVRVMRFLWFAGAVKLVNLAHRFLG